MVIVDEAFIEYIDDYKKNSSVVLTKVYSNLVVLRTFSKIYGLAGLRVGYCIASEQVINELKTMTLYYNNSTIAQKCAGLAINDFEHLREIKEKTDFNRESFLKELYKNDKIKIGSNTKTNLLILRHKKKNLFNFLKNKGIKTMQLAGSPGINNDYVRLCIRDRKSNKKIIDCLK